MKQLWIIQFYDAIRTGFGKIVFVIRHSFEKEFHEKILTKYQNLIQTEVVFQELTSIPEQFKLPEGREKPWGTNHAVLMGFGVIKEPFVVVNADDFYGWDSFKVISNYISKMQNTKNNYCMVGFHVGNTLSETGPVSRGVCSFDEDGFLTTVVERTAIQKIDGQIQFPNENGNKIILEENTLVSMNMWGFTPDYFDSSLISFQEFLTKNILNLKSEFYIPFMVNELITKGTSKVKILDSNSLWFGITYPEDKEKVKSNIIRLIDLKEYPSPLFN